jgi:hypothetical protein
MSIQATIAVTADWLCKHKPVVYTNRTKDQPMMTDPFPIYQQVVKDNKAFFRDVHGYVPLPNTKTGLAGVRSRVYTELWRDKVILPALRIYRSRTEGASLDTVPEVTFSQKPSCDGRADKSVAQRGIMGFEPAHARRGYIYNPDRNPNLLDMPPANQDDKALLTSWDKADVCNGALEDEYFEAFKAYISASGTKASKAEVVRIYLCSLCKVPKRGHVCPKATQKRKCSSARSVVKRARKVG